jgi:hypothetical protein
MELLCITAQMARSERDTPRMAGLAAFIEVEWELNASQTLIFCLLIVTCYANGGGLVFFMAHCISRVTSRSISQRMNGLEITIFLCRLFLFLFSLLSRLFHSTTFTLLSDKIPFREMGDHGN